MKPAGIGDSFAFDITARRFIYISEAAVSAMLYCSSPYFVSKAIGGNALPSKDKMFAFRPDSNPRVFPFHCQPAHLGFTTVLGADRETATDTPYTQATLNLLGGSFTGMWRAVSCACASCLFDDGSRCTSRGSYDQVPWVGYDVTRAPPPPGSRGNDAFLPRMVDALLAGSSGPLAAFAKELGHFIRDRLGRFRSAATATSWVMKRAANNKKGNWVERWIASLTSTQPNNIAPDHAHAAAVGTVSGRAGELGWQLPRNENGQPHSWESYFLLCRSK